MPRFLLYCSIPFPAPPVNMVLWVCGREGFLGELGTVEAHSLFSGHKPSVLGSHTGV